MGTTTISISKRDTMLRYNSKKRILERYFGKELSHDDFLCILLEPKIILIKGRKHMHVMNGAINML